HRMSDELGEPRRGVLAAPRRCPHGNPTPGARPTPTEPLESLRPGDSAAVERIPDQFEHEPGFLEYLDGVGIKPGVMVRLVRATSEALRIAIDGVERDVRRDCGRKVLMRA